MAQKIIKKELVNTKLANSYGGWMYCTGCNSTIGYLCYVTYGKLEFRYSCKCGSSGSAVLELEECAETSKARKKMVTLKNRLCCPEDQSPLITILSKKLEKYSCRIVCKACGKSYKEE